MIVHVPVCQGCGKFPEELDCYREVVMLELERRSVTDEEVREYVLKEEGTLNPLNNHFLCDGCYISAGMPAGTNGRRWVCP